MQKQEFQGSGAAKREIRGETQLRKTDEKYRNYRIIDASGRKLSASEDISIPANKTPA
jgi:hypothetical protein